MQVLGGISIPGLDGADGRPRPEQRHKKRPRPPSAAVSGLMGRDASYGVSPVFSQHPFAAQQGLRDGYLETPVKNQ